MKYLAITIYFSVMPNKHFTMIPLLIRLFNYLNIITVLRRVITGMLFKLYYYYTRSVLF